MINIINCKKKIRIGKRYPPLAGLSFSMHAISVQATPPVDVHVHVLHLSVLLNDSPALKFLPLYVHCPDGATVEKNT